MLVYITEEEKQDDCLMYKIPARALKNCYNWSPKKGRFQTIVPEKGPLGVSKKEKNICVIHLSLAPHHTTTFLY